MKVSNIYENRPVVNTNTRINLHLVRAESHDNINFSSLAKAGRLLKKYKINPDDVKVVATSAVEINHKTKITLLGKILEAHELSTKNLLFGNIAKAGYATNLGLADGSWHLSTNFNNTRNQISAVCGERSATLGAYNKFLNKLSLVKLKKDPAYTAKAQEKFKVTYLAMSSFKPIGSDKNAAASCADCLSWLNTDRIFSDNTRIAFLEKDESGILNLKIRSVKEMLPLRHEQESLIKNGKMLHELDFMVSPSAETSMKEKGLSFEDLSILIRSAKNTHDSNECSDFSKQNIGAAVLTNFCDIKEGKKVDWGKRWFLEPAELAIAKAVENYPNSVKINAVAYYGQGIIKDDNGIQHKDGVVSLQTLGRLKTKYGDGQTLVVSVQDDKIAIRTINDYMPEKFAFQQQYLKK